MSRVCMHAHQPAEAMLTTLTLCTSPAGSTVTRGEVEGTVEFTGKHTFFGKTAAMLQQGNNELGHLQKILLTIMVRGTAC